jgi:hypothetical protein
MFLSIAINYLFGLAIHVLKARSGPAAGLLLAAGIFGNLGILYYFKYLNFSLSALNLFFGTNFAGRDIVMPIGISFFTFQGMSYIIDLYRGKVEPQKNPALTAFYISFFPQLIAGPIVRYIDIERQIYSRNDGIEQFVRGARRFIPGLAKKVIIANTLGYTADQIFANPPIANSPASAWLGVICYSFQIYFDFSGYSDVAIGLGKIFGFEFKENFNYPYIESVHNVDTLWTDFLKNAFCVPLWHKTGANARFCPQSNRLCGQTLYIKDPYRILAPLAYFPFIVVQGICVYPPGGEPARQRVCQSFCRLFHYRALARGAVQFHCMGPLARVFSDCRAAATCQGSGTGTPRSPAVHPDHTDRHGGLGIFPGRGPAERLNNLGIMSGLLKPEHAGYTVWYYLTPNTIAALMLAVIASTPIAKTRIFRQNRVFRYAAAALGLLLFSYRRFLSFPRRTTPLYILGFRKLS